MANDPYSALGEGFTQGLGNVGQIASLKYKKAESEREAKKMQFEEMRNNMKTFAEVLKSDAPMQLRQAAANGILGMYKKHGSDMGLDPSMLPPEIKFDEEFAKGFANRILSMNKLYENKIIGPWDYRAGMFELANDYKSMTGKENPDVMKMANDIASERQARFSAVQGTDRSMFQETKPGSGTFEVMKDAQGRPITGPSVQRVEMVKPASESERTKIAEARADLDLYQNMQDVVKANPKWVGLGRDWASKLAGKFDLMPQDQQEFYTTVRLNKLKDTKFFLGTAQSKQEAKNAVAAIPDISMGSAQFKAAVETTKKNKQRMLDRTLEVLRQSGLRVPENAPPEAVLQMYNQAKASGKISPTKGKTSSATSTQPALAVLLDEALKENE